MNRKLKTLRGRYDTFIGCAFMLLILGILSTLGAAFGAPSGQDVAGTGAGLGIAFGLAGLVRNSGRQITPIAGINGVVAGGVATLNLPVNARYHRIVLNVTDGGAAAAVGTVITGIKLLVGGVSVRDITPAQMINIAQANGYKPFLGELPIFFTEPYPRAVDLEPADTLSWDMFNQSSFQIQMTIAGGTVPAITGFYEFDYFPNQLKDGKPFNQAVSMHSFTQQVVVGANDITTLPTAYPIRRLWIKTTTASAVSRLEIIQDGNRIIDLTAAQLRQALNQYGFRLRHEHDAPYQNATGPANLALDADFGAITYFDAAFISDIDYRTWKYLKAENQLIVRTTNTVAEAQTIIMETIPGFYA